MKKIFATLILAISINCFIISPAKAFPELTGGVVDEANILSESTETAINQLFDKLKIYNFVVATVNSLEGKSIEQYATDLGNYWKIGSKKHNDGVILLIAPNERLVRIATGLGMEKLMPNSVTDTIIQEQMLPYLKKNDYNTATIIASQSILMHLQGVNTNRISTVDKIKALIVLAIIIICILYYIFSAPAGMRGKRAMHVLIAIGIIFLVLWKIGKLAGHGNGNGDGSRFSKGGRFGGGGSTGKF